MDGQARFVGSDNRRTTRRVATWKSARSMKVTICGAGRTGHLNAVLFKQRPDITVSVLTGAPAVADRWAGGDGVWWAQTPDGRVLSGRPDYVGIDLSEAFVDTDMVIVTQPAHARPAILHGFAPHLPRDKQVYVG